MTGDGENIAIVGDGRCGGVGQQAVRSQKYQAVRCINVYRNNAEHFENVSKSVQMKRVHSVRYFPCSTSPLDGGNMSQAAIPAFM